MPASNSSSGLFASICSSPALYPVHPNSTFGEVVSPCLAKVLCPALAVLASIFSLAILVVYPLLFPTTQNERRRLPLAKLALAKLSLSTLDLLIAGLNLALAAWLPAYVGPSPPIQPEQFIGSLLDLAFSATALMAYAQCMRAGFITSGSLHLAWSTRLLSVLPQLGLLLDHPGINVPEQWAELLHLGIALFMTILLCAADSGEMAATGADYQRLVDQQGGQKEECPESKCSAISSFTYWYSSKMVWRGLRGTINFEQLWMLDKGDQAESLRDRFYATAKQKDAGQLLTLYSLFWRSFLCVWEWTAASVVLAIFVVFSRYATASFLRIIVLSVNAHDPLWFSLIFLFGLFLVDLAGKMLTARRDFHSFKAYLNIRSVLTTAIFDKMLRLSAAGRAKYAAGEILNLLTTDVFRIRLFFWELRDFVYCPFMIVIGLVGLFFEIGWNTMYGVGILISVLPINYALSKLNSHYEEAQMKIKDERLKLVNDVLGGVKVLKLYAWEESMQRQIFQLRHREMRSLRKIFLLDVAINVSFEIAPLIAALVSFYGYTVIQGNPMRPDVAFVSLLFFAMLRYAIYQIPQLLTYAIKAWVSGKRVLAFLNEEEQQQSHILREFPGQDQPVVLLRNCTFSWTNSQLENATMHLRDISLEVRQGQLLGIVGRVGAGKSSLLAAILGEMARQPGDGSEATVRAKTIGYVPQQAWIQNRTLRANVLFDSPMDDVRYRQVLEACALEDDLKLLVAGDLTEIGEKGINLSGGQKARVALARAVYKNAELYVLDDTLSAVDAHVGAHIFERVIGKRGLLAKKTRLWALNSLAFLQHCDQIVVMDDGKIFAIGTLDELKQQTEGPFADLIKEFMEKQLERQKSAKEADEDCAELAEVLSQLSGSPLSKSLLEHRRLIEQHPARQLSQSLQPNGNAHEQQQEMTTQRQNSCPENSVRRRFAAFSTENPSQGTHQSEYTRRQVEQQVEAELLGKLTDEEELATGMVSRRVYVDYIRYFGIWLSIGFMVSLFLGSSTFEALSSVWLARWSSSEVNSTAESAKNLAIYGGFQGVYVICTAISGIIIAVGAYHASSAFHDQLVRSLFHSPMDFFDRTPLGRILNRLSNDIDRIDENIPWAVSFAMTVFAEALNSLISICVVIPWLMVVVLPLLAIFLFVVHFYNLASVQLRRLTSKSWSSTCSFVQDAHLGADSIRVFNVKERFREQCCCLVDFTNESQAVEIFTNRWLQIRLDMISDFAVFICVLVAILLANQGVISLGSLAMVIGCGYTFTGYLGEVARVWRESEVQMVCIERVSEYIRNEQEPAWRLPRIGLHPEWPNAGHLQFQGVCLRYRPGMDLVLHDVDFEVKPGEKVGIVGRTGAGKSSLTLALFRIVEPCGGRILIDGVDICSLGLHDLRESLTIIPQDPVLFCGTFRSNLDPFAEYPDERIWEALEKAHLKETVSKLEGQLGYEVAESGSNLSVGQRQLVCLARALLRQRTRILVLDEATAAVDADTDGRIQQSIREHFRHCTLLTIAHRLNTILDYDKILVMNAGRVAEFDAPAVLLANPHSLFAQLAKQAGIGSAQWTGKTIF